MDTVGLVEEVEIIGKNVVKALALFDTGARTTSIDVGLAAKAKLGPIVRTVKVKSASVKGHKERPVVKVDVKIMGHKFDVEANLQDRSHMTFPVIIGRNVLAGNFLVDCKKNLNLFHKYFKKGGAHLEVISVNGD